MNAIILSIGDELILGQTVDTNSAWLSQQLAAVGCGIVAHATVPDDQPSIERAIRDSAARCDFLIITGGIGPTEDDLTRQALAAVMGVELDLNESWLARLTEFFKARGRDMPETNKIQAMIPRGATMIENTCGTAAGIQATLGEFAAANGSSEVWATPGVPKEMKTMFTRDILPHIQTKTGGAVILSRTLHTFGLGESWVAEKLGDLMKRDRNPSVGTTVSQGIVSLRINARFDSRELAEQQLDETIRACRSALGDVIFGQEDQTLAEVLAVPLSLARLTITTAESCTGGLLAKMLTDVSGFQHLFQDRIHHVFKRSEIDAARRRSRASNTRRGLNGRCARDGDRRTATRQGRHRTSHHRNRRPDRWNAGKAGRHGLYRAGEHRPGCSARPRPYLQLPRRSRDDPRSLGKDGAEHAAVSPAE